MNSPFMRWLEAEDWGFVWRILMDDVGVSSEGDYPYCLTPWFIP